MKTQSALFLPLLGFTLILYATTTAAEPPSRPNARQSVPLMLTSDPVWRILTSKSTEPALRLDALASLLEDQKLTSETLPLLVDFVAGDKDGVALFEKVLMTFKADRSKDEIIAQMIGRVPAKWWSLKSDIIRDWLGQPQLDSKYHVIALRHRLKAHMLEQREAPKTDQNLIFALDYAYAETVLPAFRLTPQVCDDELRRLLREQLPFVGKWYPGATTVTNGYWAWNSNNQPIGPNDFLELNDPRVHYVEGSNVDSPAVNDRLRGKARTGLLVALANAGGDLAPLSKEVVSACLSADTSDESIKAILGSLMALKSPSDLLAELRLRARRDARLKASFDTLDQR